MSNPSQPPQFYQAPVVVPRKKRKRIFMWVFLAIQVLFLIWVIGGATSGHNDTSNCGSLDAKTCQDAADTGTAIGVALVIMFWAVVDIILGITWAVIRFSRRNK